MDSILSIFQLNNVLLVKLVQILLILVLTVLVMRVISVLVRRFESRFLTPDLDPKQSARYKTFLTSGIYVVNFVVLFIAILMVLLVLGINITPVLASVGVLSLAISLGAQTLIKDYIAGVLILMEDQFRVGDYVKIEDAAGTIENITLRATSMRDQEGNVIIVPNGEIRILLRSGYDWMRVVVDFNVPFDADIGKVVDVLESAMQKAKSDPAISDFLLEPPAIQGWNSFSPWAVQVRISAKTIPDKRLNVAYELRRYGLKALNEAHLQVATPLPENIAG